MHYRNLLEWGNLILLYLMLNIYLKLTGLIFNLRPLAISEQQNITGIRDRRLEQLIRAASLQMEGLKSIGQAYSTLAAGAMAGISLGATIGADARTSASGSSNVNTSINQNAV